MTITVLTIASFLTAIISAVVGMAGGIVLLSLMTFFMPLTQIVPIHGAVQLVSNSSRAFLLKDRVKWKIIRWYLLGLPIGTVLATYVITKIENPEIAYGLIALIILYVVFKPKKMPALIIPEWGFLILSIVMGFFNPLIGATGPMQAPFFLRPDWEKEEIVATKAMSQLLGHLLKIPTFLYLGFRYLDYWQLILFMSLGVLVGTKVGVGFLAKIKQKTFILIFKTALLGAALRVLYKMYITLGY